MDSAALWNKRHRPPRMLGFASAVDSCVIRGQAQRGPCHHRRVRLGLAHRLRTCPQRFRRRRRFLFSLSLPNRRRRRRGCGLVERRGAALHKPTTVAGRPTMRSTTEATASDKSSGRVVSTFRRLLTIISPCRQCPGRQNRYLEVQHGRCCGSNCVR
jgi:hypothetical protein